MYIGVYTYIDICIYVYIGVVAWVQAWEVKGLGLLNVIPIMSNYIIIRVHACIYIYIYMYTHTYQYTCTYIYIYIHISIYTYIITYMYIMLYPHFKI